MAHANRSGRRATTWISRFATKSTSAGIFVLTALVHFY